MQEHVPRLPQVVRYVIARHVAVRTAPKRGPTEWWCVWVSILRERERPSILLHLVCFVGEVTPSMVLVLHARHALRKKTNVRMADKIAHCIADVLARFQREGNQVQQVEASEGRPLYIDASIIPYEMLEVIVKHWRCSSRTSAESCSNQRRQHDCLLPRPQNPRP